MRRSRKFHPTFDTLEHKRLPTLVLLADIDTGAMQIPSFSGSGYPVPIVPLGNYIEPGLNFLNPTVTAAVNVDLQGYGGHGSIMAAYYAEVMRVQFGIQAHVVPLIACTATSFNSDAVGRAELWVAQQQLYDYTHHLDVHWVVSLPAGINIFAGPTELAGRAALAATGVTFSQAAGNNYLNVTSLSHFFSLTPNSIVMQADNVNWQREPYSNYGSFTIQANVPDDFGTSGATMVGAAYYSAEQIAWPWLSSVSIVAHLKYQQFLRGL